MFLNSDSNISDLSCLLLFSVSGEKVTLLFFIFFSVKFKFIFCCNCNGKLLRFTPGEISDLGPKMSARPLIGKSGPKSIPPDPLDF